MKKIRNLILCTLTLLIITMCLMSTCLAVDTAQPADCDPSSQDVIDLITNSLCDDGSYDLSNEAYDMLRLYIKTNDPTDLLDDGSSLWVLSETYSLVLTTNRRLELQSGETVIKDRYAEWQTIDFAGLAEPAFSIEVLSGSTWMFDDIDGVMRRWTLGEQEILPLTEELAVL